MTLYDYESDSQRVYDVIKNGGISIIPTHVGYVIVACDPDAVWRIFRAKNRQPDKLNAVCGCKEMHTALHEVTEEQRAIVLAITEEWDLPMGTAAKVKLDHPALSNLPKDTLEQTTHEGTLAMLLNAGTLMDKVARLSFLDNRMAIGSSANLSLKGVKFRVQDIEPAILEIADIVIDYGLMRWNCYNHSSTMLNISEMKVIRYGSCYDLIKDILQTHFDITLPKNPSKKINKM
tara:strand:- start:288 stop:986 length:699 start_codon:yes stop_codon:yes gene_type:complete